MSGGSYDAGLEGFTPELAHGGGNPEALKYGKLWETEQYRLNAPGEGLAHTFLKEAKPRPGSHVVDFGCGTGRGAVVMALFGGVKVTMVDFVRNCLDPEIRQMVEETQKQALKFVK